MLENLLPRYGFDQNRLNECSLMSASGATADVLMDLSKSTGMSFGFSAGASGFARDGGRVAFEISKSIGFLRPILGVGAGVDKLASFAGPEPSPDAEPDVREFSQYHLIAGAYVPWIRIGPFGFHAAYVRQQTDRRPLDLMMGGIYWGEQNGVKIRLDVMPTFNKLAYGVGLEIITP
jgi:hypothetical protein